MMGIPEEVVDFLKETYDLELAKIKKEGVYLAHDTFNNRIERTLTRKLASVFPDESENLRVSVIDQLKADYEITKRVKVEYVVSQIID